MSETPQRFDLNLVRTFVAIYETKSVTQAAERLELTQPTISHSLAKLRESYCDRLFVRGTHGLQSTPVADRVYVRLSVSLAEIEGTLDAQRGFDPKTSDRRFRIALSDIGAVFFTPPLLQQFQRVAPHIQVEIVQLSSTVPEDLASGVLDLAIGNLPKLHALTRNQFLFRERYVCLVSAEHPSIGDSLTVEEFVQARHVLVTSPSGHALIDGTLAESGVRRNIVAMVPQFSVLPSLVEGSDLLVILPLRVASLYAGQRRLKVLDLPTAIPEFDVRMHWHSRHESAPAQRWLRAEVLQVLAGL